MQTAQGPKEPTAAGKPVVVIHDAPGAGTFTISTPMSARELNALKAQREELSSQLQSVDSRRSKLLSQLRQTGDPTAVKGLEDRLALLDKRQLQLESDLAQTGQQLSSVPAGLFAGGTLMLLVGAAPTIAAWAVPLFAVTGFALGATGPSRDMIVRGATPRGASGRVYGFVYSGLDLGATIAPVAVGALLDHHEPRALFIAVAVCLFLAIGTVLQVRRSVKAAAASPHAAD